MGGESACGAVWSLFPVLFLVGNVSFPTRKSPRVPKSPRHFESPSSLCFPGDMKQEQNWWFARSDTNCALCVLSGQFLSPFPEPLSSAFLRTWCMLERLKGGFFHLKLLAFRERMSEVVLHVIIE